MFSECMSFVIREDGVTVVGSAEDADVRLAGDDVLPRHAVINFGTGELCSFLLRVGWPTTLGRRGQYRQLESLHSLL